MNGISVAEVIELLQNESASIDMQFQLWITITSAVVIASFAARNHISWSMKTFVAVMYALASTAIVLRYLNDASQFAFLKGELVTRGVDYPAIVDLRTLRTIVYVFGTFATCVFVYLKPALTEVDALYNRSGQAKTENTVDRSRRAALWLKLND